MAITTSTYHDQFREIGFIAAGGFGSVYKAIHKLDEVEYAIKKIIVKPQKMKTIMRHIEEVKTSTELKCHLEKHINKQRNECNFCNKTFKFLSGLQKHKKIHAGARFFKCCDCQQIFNSKVKLVNHIKKQCKINRSNNVSKVRK